MYVVYKEIIRSVYCRYKRRSSNGGRIVIIIWRTFQQKTTKLHVRPVKFVTAPNKSRSFRENVRYVYVRIPHDLSILANGDAVKLLRLTYNVINLAFVFCSGLNFNPPEHAEC